MKGKQEVGHKQTRGKEGELRYFRKEKEAIKTTLEGNRRDDLNDL